jgi:hypothetical protein
MNQETEKQLEFSLPAIAATAGLADSIRYLHDLRIGSGERQRFFNKTMYLAMCYAGFSQNLSASQAAGAGHAAFLSCAYDVVTDWGKSSDVRDVFVAISHKKAPPDIVETALDMMDRDIKGVLMYDGLERGIVATNLVFQLMGVRNTFERKCNIRELGKDLQLVDDILDYEDDVIRKDQNCLTNGGMRRIYLARVESHLNDEILSRLFPYGGVLTYAIKKGRVKAHDMLLHHEQYFTHAQLIHQTAL